MTEEMTRVKRRWVFHIPGYDPFPARRYRELYRSESEKQAGLSGYDIAVQGQAKGQTDGWTVAATIDHQDVVARVDVLTWSDIVRQSMTQSIPGTYLQLFQTSWTYITTGTLRRLFWMRKGPVLAALYPVAMLLAQLFFALWLGLALGGLVESALLWLAALAGLTSGGAATALGWVAALLKYGILAVVLVNLLRWFKAQDGKLYAYYLMHDYAFTAKHRGANPPELEERIAEFTKTIGDAFSGNVDEILVVGHSSGAHIAISVLADLIRSGRVPAEGGPKLAFLSLGQVIPMVSFLPRARRLRSDMVFLATHDLITWIDVSAPGDGCSFALCDPVAVTGITPPGKRWPLIMSAAFTQTLSPETWKELRWRFFRLHFQYLCAFDRPRDYDYFQITAGPVLLADRYRDRPPSKSRIDVAVSRYTSLMP
ncbi:hypothetical protein ACJ5NV_11740 [Loktanella agnita]|uniref:hypothetical protein n=1 Tax=Loktanella agnita TaxID=287097 RepID=UPI00398890BF